MLSERQIVGSLTGAATLTVAVGKMLHVPRREFQCIGIACDRDAKNKRNQDQPGDAYHNDPQERCL